MTPLVGKLYTGYVEAQTGASTTGGQVKVEVSIKLTAVVSSDLEHWLEDVTALLGDSVMDEVASTLPCTRRDIEGGMCASRFALTAFSYAATGSTLSFGGSEEQAFPPIAEVPPQLINTYTKLLDGIYRVNRSEVTLQGELLASGDLPDVKALVSMTYFEFGDGRVTSFIGYRDPLILVSGREEVTTAAEIFSVA